MFDAGEAERRLRSSLEGYPEDPSALPDEVAAEGFASLHRAWEAVEAMRRRWLADQDRRASHRKDGFLSAAAWLTDRFGVAAGAAKAQVKVATTVREMPEGGKAFAAGAVSLGAVRILADAQVQHPEEFSLQEGALLEQAQTGTVEDLRRVVAEWSHAVDSEGAMARAERLRDRRHLQVCPTAAGMVKVEGELDPEGGESLLTAVQALIDSQVRSGDGTDLRTPTQRQADALGELARAYLDSSDRPTVGGERPHLTLTIDVRTLAGPTGRAGTVGGWQPGGAALDHIGTVHAALARRLACDATVMRVVMAGPSLPLDVGRRTPVVPSHLRRAVAIRDSRCRFPGCTRPHPWCDAHHIRHWADGGETAISNLLLLCRPHHRLVHEGGFGLSIRDGRPEFRRPDGSVIEEGRGPPGGVW